MIKLIVNFKRSLSVIMLLAFSVSSSGQGHKYIPFPDSAFIWRVVTHDLVNGKESNYQYFTNGDDTVIKGHEYFIIHYSKNTILYPSPYYYIRNDSVTRKIYIFPGPEDTLEGVLYDFSLKVGDTTKSSLSSEGMRSYPGGLIITEIDSILLDDGWHHRWHFDENGTFDTVYPMIEGIGGRCGPFESPGVFEYASWLICAMKEFKPFFPNSVDTCELATGIVESAVQEIFFKPYPNPVSDFLHISSEYEITGKINIQIFDLMGKEVLSLVFEDEGNEVIMNVSELNKGMYYYHVLTENGSSYAGRIVK